MLEHDVQEKIIRQNRTFMKGIRREDPYFDSFQSDQDQKLPQPPLVKAPMAEKEYRIDLPRNFDSLAMKDTLPQLLARRRSSRVYSGEAMTLQQLSFLLYATQGITGIRGRQYVALRPVPSGGARHPFETYLLVQQVTGLTPGAYHYLPMTHQLEYLGTPDDMDQSIRSALLEQAWAAQANVLFFWSVVAYRAEWRYGIYAHRTALIDVGHVGQNLYLSAGALGLGACAIAAFQDEICSSLFGLDGTEEFIVYTAVVGTVRGEDAAREKAFYAFLDEDHSEF